MITSLTKLSLLLVLRDPFILPVHEVKIYKILNLNVI